jgi:hypothetical protein
MSYPLAELAEFYRTPGPWSSIHLEMGWEVPDASRALELRWRALRERLDDQGAPRRHLETVDDLLNATAQPGGTACRHLVIGDEVAVDRTIRHDAPCASEARYSEVPSVAAVVEADAREAPYLVVEAARDGATISAYRADGTPVLEDEVVGETANLTKVRGGGWAHRRFQHTTEEVWRRNAKVVLEDVERVLRQLPARLLVLSGDVRAREKMKAQLTDELGSLMIEVDRHTKPEGADDHTVSSALAEVLAEQEEGERVRFLERFGDAQRDNRAVAGTGSTVHALRQAQVGVLLASLTELADRDLLALRSEPWLATSPEGITGAESIGPVPAADALLRAGALTGARYLPMPAGRMPAGEGMAALLRWPVGPS